jgi:DNA-directed RNA polymerase subunit M/transcription elongation factor TFIIS
MSIIDFMNNTDAILNGTNVRRCPKCGSEKIEIDKFMESRNEDLGRTYYCCNRCGEEFCL